MVWYKNMAKESVYIRKELNFHRIGLVQQHGKRKCLHKKSVKTPTGLVWHNNMTKESVYLRKESNSHRIGSIKQHSKRKCLLKKRVELSQDWFGTTT